MMARQPSAEIRLFVSYSEAQSLQKLRQTDDVVELRFDTLSPNLEECQALLAQLRSEAPQLQLLGTIRLAAEFGSWHSSEAERGHWFEKLLPQLDWVDIELRSPLLSVICQQAQQAGVKSIASWHSGQANCDIAALYSRAKAVNADFVKLVPTCNTLSEVQEISARLNEFRRLQPQAAKSLIMMAMGQHSILTRLLWPHLCCGIVYCHPDHSRATAPGQLAAGLQRNLHNRLPTIDSEQFPGAIGEILTELAQKELYCPPEGLQKVHQWLEQQLTLQKI